jgi:hypothetical protein
MKYLNKYGGVTKLNKLFESDDEDEDDYIPKGYKYSNNYTSLSHKNPQESLYLFSLNLNI